jgi:RNA polymerase sigma factor (TIGR02999 family)
MELNLDNLNEHIASARNGNKESLAVLFEALTGELKRIARCLMAKEPIGHTLQPTALISELYIKITQGKPGDWESPEQFVGYLHEAMKNILRDYGRSRRTLKRWGDQEKVSITEAGQVLQSDKQGVDIETWEKLLSSLERLYPVHAKVLKCKYYSDEKLTDEEIAKLCGISPSNVKRYSLFAKRWITAQLAEIMP